MDELISIIVPVFNAADVLESCIESIINQTYSNIEIIIVNDGSTDNTKKLCEKFLKSDSRINYYEQRNLGPSAARNLGLLKVHGEYIAFVDSDDYVYPDYIKKLYLLLKEKNVPLACCSCYKLSPGVKPPILNTELNSEVLNRDEALKSLFYRDKIMAYVYIKLYTKAVIIDEKFPENLNWGEDYIFVYNVLKKCPRVAYSDSPLYIYYQRGKSISHNFKMKDCQLTWSAYRKNLYRDVVMNYPNTSVAFTSSMFIFTLDCLRRLTYKQYKHPFSKRLKSYIRASFKTVVQDKCSSRKRRLLAFMCGISVTGTIYICKLLQNVFKYLGIELKNAL